MGRSYPKDKIHKDKEVGDNTTIKRESVCDMSQCPYCLALYKIGSKHSCHNHWFVCSLCRIDLHKNGRLGFKSHFTIGDKIICWNCAFLVTKRFQKLSDPKGN